MALRIALSGFVVLVVAMGIGRFAFTPQVPLMIAAGQLTLTSAGLVAAMNYLGYLVGAWDAMRAHRFVETRLWLGITGAVALTLLSAAADNAVVHGLLRFVIGCMSGWSMVLIAAWTNERLGQLGKPGLSAAVFAGPGAGIALSGLLAVYIQAKSLSAGAAWQIYGVLALVLMLTLVITSSAAALKLQKNDKSDSVRRLQQALTQLGYYSGTVDGSFGSGTKAAVKMITDGLRIDTAHTRIRVTNIKPGLVETNFSNIRFHGDTQRADNVYCGIEPLTGDDIADVAFYAACAPEHVQIAEVLVLATHQASGTVIHRD
mgnify:CR=1 FL=1